MDKYSTSKIELWWPRKSLGYKTPEELFEAELDQILLLCVN